MKDKTITMDFIEQGINQAYYTAEEKGFYKRGTSISHSLMMIITEICEAIQADRRNRHGSLPEYNRSREYASITDSYLLSIDETVESELADVAIRIMSLLGFLKKKCNYRLMSEDEFVFQKDCFLVNLKHLYIPFTEIMFDLTKKITSKELETSPAWLIAYNMQLILAYLYAISIYLIFDLKEYITIKMEYNKERPYYHNKKY